MNKTLLFGGIALGGAAVAFLIYKYTVTPTQSYSNTSVNPNSNPNYTSGDQAAYPFVANVPPRMDNSNQSWANNNRAAISGVSSPQLDVNLTNTNMFASVLKSGSSIIDSGQSIWGDVSDWFGSDDEGDLAGDWSFGGSDDIFSSEGWA